MSLLNAIQKAEKARKHYGPYSSPHEALGVMMEEFNELQDAIHANDWPHAREEAEDIAAVRRMDRYNGILIRHLHTFQSKEIQASIDCC